MLRRGRSLLPARAGPLLQASHPAGQCRRGSSTRSYTTSAPAVLLVPQSPPDAGKRETDAVCCPPGSVEKRGTSSLSKVRHGSTSTIFAGKRDSFSPALALG